MGASVVACWPGITEEQVESQPSFYNDCNAWGSWMAEREEDPDALDAVKRLRAEAVLTYKTDGMEDEDVGWVSPLQLRDAATRLREAVRVGAPDGEIVLKSYERNANGIAPIAEELIRDLDDIIALASWAENEGAEKVTLEVNW